MGTFGRFGPTSIRAATSSGPNRTVFGPRTYSLEKIVSGDYSHKGTLQRRYESALSLKSASRLGIPIHVRFPPAAAGEPTFRTPDRASTYIADDLSFRLSEADSLYWRVP
jgi:hypothetical protein